MRLIDANFVLSRVKPYSPDDENWTATGGTAIRLIHNIINDAPTVDAIQVVRCKECKWFSTDIMECECDDVATDHEGGASFSINFGPDDFCSYGERKDGAE